MESYLTFLKALAPEWYSAAKERLTILQSIKQHQPMGRRLLAAQLQLSERKLRTEIEQLKILGFVYVTKQGIQLSSQAEQLLTHVALAFNTNDSLAAKAQLLLEKFNIKHCVVVPGNSETDDFVFEEFGKVLTSVLNELLPLGQNILAVTGGTTLAKVIPHISKELSTNRTFTVVSARGGGLEAPTIQANTLSHNLSTVLNGEAVTLFVPEQLGVQAQQSLMKDPSVYQAIELLSMANCFIYSLGSSHVMVDRRGVSKEEREKIALHQAVGEAMGIFFDKQGKIVHRLDRIGLVLEDLEHLSSSVLIVGGVQKAEALNAYMNLAPRQTVLLVDEALANSVLKEETLKKI